MPNDLSQLLNNMGASARLASRQLALASSEQKKSALLSMARHIDKDQDLILAANQKDVKSAKEKELRPAMLDRLILNETRVEGIVSSLKSIANMVDPVGEIEKTWDRENGLKFSKVRIPIGVIGMIYESRPNVTADAGALCLKAGNACILRGGSESVNSNRAIHQTLIKGLKEANLPETSIQLIPTTDRAAVGHMLGGLDNNIDMIIPRGGKSLIARVQSDARVPVLAHLEGLCHTYVHNQADLEMAQNVVLNAKLRRTGVCGSTETLLIDQAIAAAFLPGMAKALVANDCELRGDDQAIALFSSMSPASEEDYFTEYLAPILTIKIVNGLEEAIDHINHYGSGHTDSIITEDQAAADHFQRAVDSAIVMHNASTQFADGGEFGFGAEIGISTGRLHARGPVGAEHLTTYKYLVHGNGNIRPS